MSRIALFALAAAAVFAAAFAGGRVLDVDERSVSDEAHAAPDDVHDVAPPGGLALAEDGYRLVPERAALESGRVRTFSFRLLGPDGAPVRALEPEHERRLHLIVVRRELDWYLHLHPEQRPDGSWGARLRLPVAGVYRAFADFSVGGTRRTLGVDLFGHGGSGLAPATPPRRFDVSSTHHGSQLVFHVRRDGNVVRLQPYLGARGHLVVLREGDLAYVHAHADEDRLAFDVPFPGPGSYRLFLQFKVGGSVQLATFGLRR